MRSRNKQCCFFPSDSGAVSSPSLTLRIPGWHEADTGVWSRKNPCQTCREEGEKLRIGKNVNILIVLEEETCWETERSVWKWPHFSMLACQRSTLRHTHTHTHTHTQRLFNLLRAISSPNTLLFRFISVSASQKRTLQISRPRFHVHFCRECSPNSRWS